jgi:hypothetical protein
MCCAPLGPTPQCRVGTNRAPAPPPVEGCTKQHALLPYQPAPYPLGVRASTAVQFNALCSKRGWQVKQAHNACQAVNASPQHASKHAKQAPTDPITPPQQLRHVRRDPKARTTLHSSCKNNSTHGNSTASAAADRQPIARAHI